MKPPSTVIIIVAGYAVALAVACVAVAIRNAFIDPADAQASSGMHAFADAFLFSIVFGLLALAPTAAALWRLRSFRSFWVALAAMSIGLALTGVAAAALFALGRNAPPAAPLAIWASLAMLRILPAVLLTPAFLVCALISPHRGPRLALLAATAMEAVVCAYAGLAWFVPLFNRGW